MKRIVVVCFLLISALSFGDQIIINGNFKINLRDDSTYSVVYDGEIVTLSNGKKAVLRNDKTWDYLPERSNLIINDKGGRRIWIKSDGRWGYLRNTYEKDDFKFRGTSFNAEGGNTRIIGYVKNLSGENYSNVSYEVIVFDKELYEYRTIGEFDTGNFMSGEEIRFEGVLNFRKDKIADYYIEVKQATKQEMIKKIKVEKPKKKNAVQLYMELDTEN